MLNLEYSRDKYKQIEDILNNKEEINEHDIKDIEKNLKQLGEINLINNINQIKKYDYKDSLIKEVFKEVIGSDINLDNTTNRNFKIKEDNIQENIPESTNTLKDRETAHNIYNFKTIDELYDIFKLDAEKYKKENILNKNLDIVKIFNDDKFESYLKFLDDGFPLSVYQRLNIKIYSIYEINLFFYILGYEDYLIKTKPNIKNNIEHKENQISINQSIKDEVYLKKLLNIYYIEDLDYIYKYDIYNNKNSTIKIGKCRDLLNPSINKTLSKIFKNKMMRFNSSIFIQGKNKFKSKNKNKDINTDCKILIYTKKSEHEINLYQLKIHMQR